MKQRNNKRIKGFKNYFYNIQINSNKFNTIFFLPTVIKTQSIYPSWDLKMFSLLFAIGRKSIQFNIYKSVKDLSKNINQNDIKKLLVMLKHEKYSIDISNKTILNQLTKYLNQNIFILTLLKNSNEKNKYITKIIANILCEEVFVNKIK